jgi:Glycosyltransferases involved in cell wall biogenesis
VTMERETRTARAAKPTLTVFTPTYNRAYILPRCYESMRRQTSKDFVWLIIDDGSTDHTAELVRGWIAEGEVEIRYHYQENQGMHGAHNAAYALIDTELNVCIDSDDDMPDDAVEKIIAFWREHGSDAYAGIIGLDADRDGNIIGDRLPEGLTACTLSGLHAIHRVRGDKKLVYRTDLVKAVPPYPLFPGEKYCPLSYKYLLIDRIRPLLLMNEVLCRVEYLPDGSSLNMIRQYRSNPRGFAFFRRTAMDVAPTWKQRFREAVHYVSSCLMTGGRGMLRDSPRKGLTLLAFPLGVLLNLYIRSTRRSAPGTAGR